MRTIVRFLIGYILGAGFFVFFIPYLLYLISKVDPFGDISLFHSFTLRIFLSFPVCSIGALFALWSNISLVTVGKGGPTDVFNFAISPRSKHLVVTGPYRYTRNPMVFGMLCIWFSWSLFLNSITCILICFFIIPLAILYLKKNEEKRLEKDFGDAFRNYQSDVPILFPLPSFLHKLFFNRVKKRK